MISLFMFALNSWSKIEVIACLFFEMNVMISFTPVFFHLYDQHRPYCLHIEVRGHARHQHEHSPHSFITNASSNTVFQPQNHQTSVLSISAL